ncbi:MAG: SCP2 sterol-binding domain-containing protein [Candidatus Hodarchaeota archaeon]
MVDETLPKKLAELKESGAMSSDPKNILILMELIKQASLENEDLKEELENIDTVTAQMMVIDKDFKWWIRLGDGDFDYGEGEDESASFSMKSDWKTISGVLVGEIDGTAAYLAGSLKMEGNLQNSMAFGDYFEFAMDIIAELGYWKAK